MSSISTKSQSFNNFMLHNGYPASCSKKHDRLDYQTRFGRGACAPTLREEHRLDSRERGETSLCTNTRELLMSTSSCVCWTGRWHIQPRQSFLQTCGRQQKHSRCSPYKVRPAFEKYLAQTSTKNSKTRTRVTITVSFIHRKVTKERPSRNA